MIRQQNVLCRPFDKNIAARAPQREYLAVVDPDFISTRDRNRGGAAFAASSAASRATRRRLAEQALRDRADRDDGGDDEGSSSSSMLATMEQLRPELLRPPSGAHFSTYDGRFDVCRWWGSRIGPSTASAPRVSQFGSATLNDLLAELATSKPIETLAMASPWFPLNGSAIASIVDAAMTLNKKNLQQVFVSSDEDRKLVQRLLRREGLEKVAVLVE